MKVDWSVRFTTLPCRLGNCKWYWKDLKYCTKHKILTFDDDFYKIQTNKCLEKTEEEDINMCNLTRREIV